MSGILMELGFLKRLSAGPLGSRVGHIYGTSAGALCGFAYALGLVDELEEFLLTLQPADVFAPNRLWRIPLFGFADYSLPESVRGFFGDPKQLAAKLAESEIELTVIVTDLDGRPEEHSPQRLFERACNSRDVTPETMTEAIFASAAIPQLVLPIRVDGRACSDGGWVRHFPLGYAYDNPAVEQIVAFRCLPTFETASDDSLHSLNRHLRRYQRIPVIRHLIEEVDKALERGRTGEPLHLGDMLMRLSLITFSRNSTLEELVAREKDETLAAYTELRRGVLELARTEMKVKPKQLAQLEQLFAATDSHFHRDRVIPRVTINADPGARRLESNLRKPHYWPLEAKRELILLGYELADEQLTVAGF